MSDILAENDGAKARPSLVHTLSAATMVQIVATASVLALTAIAPTVAESLGIQAYWIGYQISGIYAAGVFSSAAAGSLVERFGAATMERFALLCFVMGLFGLASGQIPLILVATIAIGIGYGLNNPAASQMLSRITPPHRRNLVFSLKQSGVPLGGIVASFAFPFLTQSFGWHAALAIAGLAPLVVWIWLFLTHRDPPGAPHERVPFVRAFLNDQAIIWANRKLAALSMIGLLYSAMQLSISAFAVVMLVHDAGWSLLSAGSVAAVMQLAGAIGRIGWGVFADRIGGGFLTLSLLGAISGLCCVLFVGLADYLTSAQIGLLLAMGLTSIGWNGVLLAEIARNAPQARVGALTGGVLVYTFIGVIIGPSSFAAIYSVVESYGIAFLAFSVFGFIGMLVGLLAHRKA